MILADTSAWVEFDRATGSAVDRRMLQLLDRGVDLAVTEPVAAEVLMGARTSEREDDLRRLLGSHGLLAFDVGVDFDNAVAIYRACRTNGVTPRGLVDCLVAAVAIRHDAAVLAADRDLAAIAGVVNLRLDPASTT